MLQVLLTLLLAPLLRLLARSPAVPPRRVLVVQVAKIGDMACTTPLLRELAQGLPGARVTVLAGPAAAPLLAANPHVAEVIVAGPAQTGSLGARLRLAAHLRREGFDAALCCNAGGNWPTLLLWAGIPKRLGVVPNFLGRTTRLAGRLWTATATHRGDRLIVETYFELLRRLGIEPRNPAKEVFVTPDAAAQATALLPDGPRWIGLAVSAANKLKELGNDKLAALAAALLAARPDCRLALLGGPPDKAQAAAVTAALPAELRSRVADLTGAVGVAGIPALLARLSLFVGVDSGLTYIADALGIPLVSVAGPCNMAETRPVGARAVIVQRQMPCLPCAHIFRAPYACRIGTRACIVEIGAEEIAATALRLLPEVPEGSPSPLPLPPEGRGVDAGSGR